MHMLPEIEFDFGPEEPVPTLHLTLTLRAGAKTDGKELSLILSKFH